MQKNAVFHGAIRNNSVQAPSIDKIILSFHDPQEAKIAESKFRSEKDVVFTSTANKGDLHVTFTHPMSINHISSLLANLGIDMDFSKMINGIAYFDDIPF